MATFMTLFATFAMGGPIIFWFATLGGHGEGAPAWWTYPLWIAQDAAIYAAVMAANSFFVRRDRAWLLPRIRQLVSDGDAE